MPDQKSSDSKPLSLNEQIEQLSAANKKLREDRDFLLEKFNKKREEREKLLLELQALRHEKAKHNEALKDKDQTIIMIKDELARTQKNVDVYLNSTSWKITAPLRKLVNLFRRN